MRCWPNGGRAIGVIPELLVNKEVGHNGLTELHVVPDMHHRKKMMADLSDAFVAMPGGVGTFEELFEVYTWAQLGYHQKAVALLNVDGYYDPLINRCCSTRSRKASCARPISTCCRSTPIPPR